MVGRMKRTEPGRSYQVPARTARTGGALGRLGYPVAMPASRVARRARLAAARARGRLRRVRGAGRSFDPTGPCTGRRHGAGRLPGPRGARPEDLPRRRAREPQFGAQLHAERAGAAGRGGHRRGALRRRHVDVRGRAGRRPGRVPRARPGRRRSGHFFAPTAQTAAGPGSSASPPRRSPGGRAAGSTRRPATDPDGHHLAGGRARRRQRGHHQRPARSPHPGGDRRVSVDADVAVHRATRTGQAHRRPGWCRR